MSTTFFPLLCCCYLARLRLMSTSLLVLPLSLSLILLTDCLEVGAVVLIGAKLVAVVAFCIAETLSLNLHGDAAFRDTSG